MAVGTRTVAVAVFPVTGVAVFPGSSVGLFTSGSEVSGRAPVKGKVGVGVGSTGVTRAIPPGLAF